MLTALKLLATAVVLFACYSNILRGMVDQWLSDEDMGHAFLVPLVIAWIGWRERERWNTLPVKPTWWGMAVLALAALLHAVSAIGGGLFAGSVAFLMSVTGAILCLGGIAWVRVWAFPLVLSLFMLPKLAIVYNQVTLPLQLIASRMAATMLTSTGFAVIREGNILDVGGHRVAVAEACDGIRFLLPLAFIALLFAYLNEGTTGRKIPMRIALLLSAIPIALVTNAVRVSASGAWRALDSGLPHDALGVGVFLLSLALVVAFRKVLVALHV